MPVQSVPDLIKQPGRSELSYGSGVPGHTAHIYAELLKSMTGIQMVHVPYKGQPALNDVARRDCERPHLSLRNERQGWKRVAEHQLNVSPTHEAAVGTRYPTDIAGSQ